MSHFLQVIWQGVTGATWIEQVATVLGLLGVGLTIKQSLWNFPVGLVQVVLVGGVFYGQRLYADMSLQGFFFIVLAYGWWHWARPGGERAVLPVTRMGAAGRLGVVAAGVVAALALGWVLREFTRDPMPFRDAFLFTFGILSQWLQARKKIENWAGWMFVNALGLTVYVLIGLYWFVVLYALYFALAVAGHFEWRKSMRGEAAHG